MVKMLEVKDMAEIKEIEIEKIREPENAARLDPKDDSIYELAESIMAVGLINPITVKQVGEDEYEVVAGHRRLLACQLAGLKKIPCIVKRADEELLDSIMLTENTARKDLSPIEEACKLKELQEKRNLGIGALARIVGRSKSWVRQRLDLLNIKPELQKAVHEGKISIDAAFTLDKVDDDETRMRWLKQAEAGEVSANTLKMWLATYEEAKRIDEEFGDEIEERVERAVSEPPKGQCQICGGRYLYEKLTTLIVCRECRFHLMKAVKEAELQQEEESGSVRNTQQGDRGDFTIMDVASGTETGEIRREDMRVLDRIQDKEG